MPVALITGASRGLGRALSDALAERGWTLVLDARGARPLEHAAHELRGRGAADVLAIAGDVTDPAHRRDLRDVVAECGGLDLLVNNASTLGASPLPPLLAHDADTLRRVYDVNVFAPLALIALTAPLLASRAGTVVNIGSDAAVNAYPAWGGYGSAKAALEHIGATLAVEHPGFAVHSFDPGDMDTDLHRLACPGEDLSHLPRPADVVPALLRLIDERPPSGRHTAATLGAAVLS